MYKPGTKIGILGGGQLAQMLAISAIEMGLEPWILCKETELSAQAVCCHKVYYSELSLSVVNSFLKKVDVCTFESEFIDTDLLLKADEQNKLFPSPKSMATIRDRKFQKELLQKYQVPTSPFMALNSATNYSAPASTLAKNFVLKKRLFGYDGYGTFIIKNEKSYDKALQQSDSGFIAESFIKFKRELAFMIFRSGDGSIDHLPLVETKQVNSRCLWVKGPIKHKKFNALKNKMATLLKNENYVGAMGVELFDTGSELIVNELAPRVHNSGHYSQDAFSHSQFDLHLLCLLAEKLPKVSPKNKAFAMVNLLGTGRSSLVFKPLANVKLHWYHKGSSAKGRKMGHINCVGTESSQCLKQALKASEGIKI